MPSPSVQEVSKAAAEEEVVVPALPPIAAPPDDDAAASGGPTAYDLPPDESKPAAATASSKSRGPGPGISGEIKCACANSKCLKLYCECLRKGEYCNDDCVCNDCYNTKADDGEGGVRLEAIRYIFGRNPDALTEETRVMAQQGGWEPPTKPPKKSPFQKMFRGKSSKKTPMKSSAGKTIAKAKNARSKDVTIHVGKMDDTDSSEEETSKVAAIPYSAEEFPQLVLDGTEDCSDLATAFSRPLFHEPSRPLEIAYSQHAAAQNKRQQAQRKKNAVLWEYNQIREKFLQKKLELSLANDVVKGHSQTVGAWTRKVFDLELEEPCNWNTNYNKLKAYREEHGKLPPNFKKAKGDEEKSLGLWLDRIRGQKNAEERDDYPEDPPKKKRSKSKSFVKDYPHRLESLADLGVIWENYNDNKWEVMFQKLLIYKEEQGTLRFPSDDQCVATGDEELLALQKWVKGQVLTFRYGFKKKNPEIVKRLLDIGFDFEKWYAKPGKGSKKMKGEKVPKFNEMAKETVDELVEELDDRKMPAKEEGGDVKMYVGESAPV